MCRNYHNKLLYFQNLILCVFLVSISNVSKAQIFYTKIDSIVNAYVDSNNSNGISVAIIDSNRVTYINKGFISDKNKVVVTENTIFEIGSCTKTMNGLLLAYAITEGKININDYIDDYLKPEVNFKPNLQHKITFQDLITHHSGLPPYHNTNDFDNDLDYDSIHPYRHINTKYAFNLLNNLDSLTSLDSNEYIYNNFAAGLAGLILERIYQMSWEDLFQQKICNDLNLHSTSTKVNNQLIYAQGYYLKEPIDFIDVGFMIGAGLLKSNAVDMAKYITAYVFPTYPSVILSQKILKDYDGLYMSYAWFVQKLKNGSYFYLHPGDTNGQSSFIGFNKSSKKGIVILSNSQNDELKSLFSKIVDLL